MEKFQSEQIKIANAHQTVKKFYNIQCLNWDDNILKDYMKYQTDYLQFYYIPFKKLFEDKKKWKKVSKLLKNEDELFNVMIFPRKYKNSLKLNILFDGQIFQKSSECFSYKKNQLNISLNNKESGFTTIDKSQFMKKQIEYLIYFEKQVQYNLNSCFTQKDEIIENDLQNKFTVQFFKQNGIYRLLLDIRSTQTINQYIETKIFQKKYDNVRYIYETQDSNQMECVMINQETIKNQNQDSLAYSLLNVNKYVKFPPKNLALDWLINLNSKFNPYEYKNLSDYIDSLMEISIEQNIQKFVSLLTELYYVYSRNCIYYQRITTINLYLRGLINTVTGRYQYFHSSKFYGSPNKNYNFESHRIINYYVKQLRKKFNLSDQKKKFKQKFVKLTKELFPYMFSYMGYSQGAFRSLERFYNSKTYQKFCFLLYEFFYLILNTQDDVETLEKKFNIIEQKTINLQAFLLKYFKLRQQIIFQRKIQIQNLLQNIVKGMQKRLHFKINQNLNQQDKIDLNKNSQNFYQYQIQKSLKHDTEKLDELQEHEIQQQKQSLQRNSFRIGQKIDQQTQKIFGDVIKNKNYFSNFDHIKLSKEDFMTKADKSDFNHYITNQKILLTNNTDDNEDINDEKNL